MPQRLIIIAISSVYWVLWTLALPWFVFALNRKVTRVPAIRKFFIPQPSRLVLQSLMKKRGSPDEGSQAEPPYDPALWSKGKTS